VIKSFNKEQTGNFTESNSIFNNNYRSNTKGMII